MKLGCAANVAIKKCQNRNKKSTFPPNYFLKIRNFYKSTYF